MTFKLAHLSDIHLGPLPRVNLRELMSKRLTGYINWQRNRAKSMRDNTLDLLVGHMLAAHPDHVAVTGDLINLGLNGEFGIARTWLERLGTGHDISVVLGNHDTYVPGAFENSLQAWQPYMCGDGQVEPAFPYRRTRGKIALLGANSGGATLPFMATGLFDTSQASRLSALLEAAKSEDLFRVVMIHHPPFPHATSWHKRLIGAALFRDVIAQHGAELVLHGHTHIDSVEFIRGPNGSVPIIGVPSASQKPNPFGTAQSRKPAGRYNLFSISGEVGNWHCTQEEFGFVAGGNTVEPISTRTLWQDGTCLQTKP